MVTVIELWRRIRCTVAGDTPIVKSNVAHEWRRSWTRSWGTFAFSHRLWNIRLAFRGSMKLPWEVVKTNPVSRHREPAVKPFLELSLAMPSQNGHQRGWYGQHRDRCVGFHRVQSQLPVYPMQCLPDCQSAVLEIDVGPCETECLTAPQPHRQRDGPQCVQPVLFGSFEKAKRFSTGEASNLAIIGHPQLHQPRDVSTEQFLSTASCSAARSTRGCGGSNSPTERPGSIPGWRARSTGLFPSGIPAMGAALTFRTKLA